MKRSWLTPSTFPSSLPSLSFFYLLHFSSLTHRRDSFSVERSRTNRLRISGPPAQRSAGRLLPTRILMVDFNDWEIKSVHYIPTISIIQPHPSKISWLFHGNKKKPDLCQKWVLCSVAPTLTERASESLNAWEENTHISHSTGNALAGLDLNEVQIEGCLHGRQL